MSTGKYKIGNQKRTLKPLLIFSRDNNPYVIRKSIPVTVKKAAIITHCRENKLSTRKKENWRGMKQKIVAHGYFTKFKISLSLVSEGLEMIMRTEDKETGGMHTNDKREL